jgi:hypothetical protein
VDGGYNPPPHYWCFVPHQYVTNAHVNNYYVNERENTTIINNTTVIHNTTIVNNTTVVNNRRVNNYTGGPDAGEVSRVTGNQLHPVAVRESNSPGANRTAGMFAIYRPRINAAPQGNNSRDNGGPVSRPAPTRVQHLDNVHPANTTIYNNNRGAVNNTTGNNATINNNTDNNFHPSQNPGNAGQPGGQAGLQLNRQPVGQTGNPAESRPNNTRFIPGANTNNGNPAFRNPAVTNPAVTNPPVTNPPVTPVPAAPAPAGNVRPGGNPVPVNNRLPATGTDNGNGNGYRNNGNGNGNGNGGRNNGNGNVRGNGNGNNGNGNGRSNAGNGNTNGHPGQPGTTADQPRARFQQGPKPKDTVKPNPRNHP